MAISPFVKVGNNTYKPPNDDIAQAIAKYWGTDLTPNNASGGTLASSSGGTGGIVGRANPADNSPGQGTAGLPWALRMKLNNPANRFSPYGGSEPRNAFSAGEQFQVTRAFPGLIDLAAAWKPQRI